MKKNPTITIDDWLGAEELARTMSATPQPKNTLTLEQYAELRGLSPSGSRRILNELLRNRLATREKWGQKWVYKLNPK